MSRGKVQVGESEIAPQQNQQESHLSAALAAVVDAFQADVNKVLLKVTDHAQQIETALDGVTLLTKAEAGKRLKISMASLDRKVTRGEIEATYLDRRIRFKVTELERFIHLRTGPTPRSRRRL